VGKWSGCWIAFGSVEGLDAHPNIIFSYVLTSHLHGPFFPSLWNFNIVIPAFSTALGAKRIDDALIKIQSEFSTCLFLRSRLVQTSKLPAMITFSCISGCPLVFRIPSHPMCPLLDLRHFLLVPPHIRPISPRTNFPHPSATEERQLLTYGPLRTGSRATRRSSCTCS